jgi:tRNA pseudouridine55 synthase
LNGIINVLKPPGMTSQNVVSYVKKELNVKKAGHTGTLDPGAAGVLPVCIGKATRVSEYLINDKKSYRAELQLGYKSDTLDKYGIVEKASIPDFNKDDIERVFESFKGVIYQTPPMFSALKKDGVRLYDLARAGITVDRKERKVNIYDINILTINGYKILFDVTCSKGTYIRTLCSDIGEALGGYGIMSFLLRTRTGPFDISKSVKLDDIKGILYNGNIDDILNPTFYALDEYSRIFVPREIADKIKNGVGFHYSDIKRYEKRNNDEILVIFDEENNFLAIGKITKENNQINIDKVFI